MPNRESWIWVNMNLGKSIAGRWGEVLSLGSAIERQVWEGNVRGGNAGRSGCLGPISGQAYHFQPPLPYFIAMQWPETTIEWGWTLETLLLGIAAVLPCMMLRGCNASTKNSYFPVSSCLTLAGTNTWKCPPPPVDDSHLNENRWFKRLLYGDNTILLNYSVPCFPYHCKNGEMHDCHIVGTERWGRMDKHVSDMLSPY